MENDEREACGVPPLEDRQRACNGLLCTQQQDGAGCWPRTRSIEVPT